MVGIVIVSHSHGIAEGIAELARQMAGEDVTVEATGGLDQPDNPIGTDAMLVVAAIERAWSDDGVLVLMDLGSAVLSTEMAVDFLDEERRAMVRLTDAPVVEGAVAAAVTARMGGTLDEVAREAAGGLAGKAAHLGLDTEATAPGRGVRYVGTGPEERLELVVDLPHGLHARPAARFVQTATGFDAEISVRNATTGRGPVSARSLNAVATLGVTAGQSIEVVARGPEAAAAAAAVRALDARRWDEVPEDLVGGPAERRPEGGVTTGSPSGASVNGLLRGIAASPGVAIGPARRFHVPDLPAPPERPADEPDGEVARLDAALADTRAAIERQREDANALTGPGGGAIFDAHLLFLHDEELLDPAGAEIRKGRSAAVAWNDAVGSVARRWDELDDPYLRARAADLRSVGRQVLARLLGLEPERPRLEAPGILIAPDLEPADMANLDPTVCLGIATAHGGATSHAAVLARTLGIPAVVGVGEQLDGIAEGTVVAIDTEAAAVHVDPPSDVVATLVAAREARAALEAESRARATAPAAMRDGTVVEVAANIGAPQEVEAAMDAGCDGVGLFRTEFLFMGRDDLPDEDEQERAYRDAAEQLAGRPLLVRTLDAGADKPVPALGQPREANPFLGVRGVRLGLAEPDVLATQLRALLRVAADHPLRIMFPMVATLAEVRSARAALEAARAAIAVDARPEVGVMIEVPAAAIGAGHLAPEVDFFSVGTNDLTQYTLAADRGNERVASLADPLHPAVLRLVELACEAATAHGIWVGVCGELAGDPSATALLLGLGVRELSMAPPGIPPVKDAVRAVEPAEARSLAGRALDGATAEDVRALLHH